MEYVGTKTLFALGWQPFFESQLDSERSESSVPARVIAHYGSRVALMRLSETGQLTEQIVPVSLLTSAKGGGQIQLAVGDWLLVDRETSRATMQLERKTSLSRKAAGERSVEQLIAANVDTFIIVCSCNQDFNLSRLERYLALVAESGANSVVVLTKADLCEDAIQLRRETERLVPGLLVEDN